MSELQAIETPDTSAEGPDHQEAQEVAGGDERIEEARAKGWVDKDQWVEQGNDPTLHRDHEAFLDYGDSWARSKILKEEKNRVFQDYTQVKKKLDTLTKFYETNLQIAVDQALAEKESAKQNMDIEGFEKATEKLQKLQEKPAESENDPRAAQDWVTNNSWFNKDQRLTELAKDFDVAIAQRNLSPQEHFAALDEKMKPFLTKEPPIQTVASGRRASNVSKTGWDSLDAEEKANFENVKNFPAYSGNAGKEKYAKTILSYKTRHGE